MDKKPFVTLEQLREIEKTYPTSFYIYNERGIRENAAKLEQAFSWNKGYKKYFAVRAAPSPFLLNILKDMGCDTNYSSMIELMMFRACGFSGPGIIFSSSDTPPEKSAYTKKLEAIINLDDITRMQCLEGTLRHVSEIINCRFNPDGLFKIGNNIIDNPGDSKYGVTIEQIGQVFKILKEESAKHLGVRALLTNNTVTDEYYPTLVKILFELAVRPREETGIRIAFINPSGGIGIPYHPDQEPSDTLIIGDDVRRIYEKILVPVGMEDVALCTELERFMMGPYDALVTKAIHKKHTYKRYMGVDACAVNLVRPAMYGAYYHITAMGQGDEPCTRMYSVVGSLCESNDKFAIDHMLPEVRKGDLLFVHDAGAHGLAMGYNYNGKLKSAELLLKEDGTVEMARKTETPEDYLATFDLCDILRDIK